MRLENVSILVIDDEQMIVEQLCIFLSSLGYKPTGRTKPQEGLALLQARRYDVVMVDLQMRNCGMDIVESSEEQHVDTQIIIITAVSHRDSAIELLIWDVRLSS
jgi:DNA-binding NtrC family response regulator